MRKSSGLTSIYQFADGQYDSAQLQQQLADARLLQRISTELIHQDDIDSLYKKIVTAAVEIMGSQFGTIQMLYPDTAGTVKLRLLASFGFTPEAEKYWEWVYQHTGSSCGEVLRKRKRVVISDYASCGFMQGEPTLKVFLEGGILAAQSTPLFSRTGELLGMISTHWNYCHSPSERDLNLLDILARQAADLIERTQQAEILQRSEERLVALITATNDAIYRMSADWKEMYMFDGKNFHSDTGIPIDWMKQYVHPADRELVTLAIQKAIQQKEVFQLDYRFFKEDGTVGWTSSRAVPILSTEGNIIEWFGAASDITDKKLLLIKLEEKVEERTRELHRSNEDLQQFAHVASHDLKEPVRKIKIFGRRLRDEMNGQASENLNFFNNKILESASRMSTMIDGVLAYSSFTATENKIETIDLNKILSDIYNDLEILIGEKDAIIEHDVLPEIEGIEVLMYQLFYNLINNSLKFTQIDKHPVVKIQINKLSNAQVSFVEISVTDNGIGFQPEYAGRIFDAFTRLHPKSRYEGTGLGLALVKKIVERHHGTIEAKSQIDEGAVFTLRLPMKQPV